MVGQLSSSFPGVNIISEETNSKIKDVGQVKFNLINKAEMIGELRDLATNRHVALSEITIWVDPLGWFCFGDFWFQNLNLSSYSYLSVLISFQMPLKSTPKAL